MKSYVKFIRGFYTPAPQELVESQTSALCQGLCLSAHLDVLTMWADEEGITALIFKVLV